MAANIASSTSAITMSGTFQAYARGRENATIARMLSSLCFALSILYSVATSIQPDSPTCTTAVECRQAANEALGRVPRASAAVRRMRS